MKPKEQIITKGRDSYPFIPLRDVVIFPRMVASLFVGRPVSLKTLKVATSESLPIFLVTQRSSEVDNPNQKDLYENGCVARIIQVLPLPDGTIKILVEGLCRAGLVNLQESEGVIRATVDPKESEDDVESPDQVEALQKSLLEQFKQILKAGRNIQDDVYQKIQASDTLDRLTDAMVVSLNLDLSVQQQFLDKTSVSERANDLLVCLGKDLAVHKIERRIRNRVKEQIEKSQREFYLNEQVKAIQKELGDDVPSELEDLQNRVLACKMSKPAELKCLQEIKKLKTMSTMSAEATVVRSYIETLVGLPWQKRSKGSSSLVRARKILDKDHYALEKVKDRILEHLAVQRRSKNPKSPILCFLGPPGVGKTSLGRSIAVATGREFVRISLGGVRDEADIRGHRRTYVGSLPGKIIQGMTRAGTKNPVFMLDEIDKMGMDFRGDPASALLEVLDPEQNQNFSDHYVEVDYDLSEVMFIATANTMNIPPPLLDRLEIIRISGYTEDEKLHIAQEHLLEKQYELNGIAKNEVAISQPALLDIVRYYTREAGVRDLERSISKICRKLVMKSTLEADKEKAKSKAKKTDDRPSKAKQKTAVSTTKPKLSENVDVDSLKDFLGVRQYKFGRAFEENRIGQVVGLAWTEMGGDLLSIEVAQFFGKGKIICTGKLGEVMQESIKAAVSVARLHAPDLGLAPDFLQEKDIHVHLPEGGIPKDGPSAGIGIAMGILSTFSDRPVRGDTAMTGEITLRGEILPIGGVKEKLLAAHRGGIKRVILPEENRKDMEDVPKDIQDEMQFIWAKWFGDLIDEVLVPVKSSKGKAKSQKKLLSDESIPASKNKDFPAKSVTH